jgi:Na+/H+ antiporter NhaD/arsenite permease-like protein
MSAEINVLNAAIILSIFGITYVGIIHTRVDKTTASVLGGLIATIAILLMRLEDPHSVGEILDEEGLVHFRDLQIIGLIFGTLMLVDVSQESGVFHYISVKILKLSKGDPKTLLRYFGGLTLILSALVNNISAMMIVGSLTLIACERLELNPKPYIIVELSMTTVGGIVTLISSVPNIIIAQVFGITFIAFFQIGALFAILCMFVNFIIFERMFKEDFTAKMDPKELERRVNEFDEWSAVKDRGFFNKSIAVLTVTIIAFVFSDQIGVSLAVIAISGGIAIVVLSGKKLDDVMAKLDWNLISFFLGLFILIAALEVVGILEYIAEWLIEILPENGFWAAIILLWFVAIISGIVDNIVVAAAFSKILFTVATVNASYSPEVIAWATIFAANFGGGLTPIGAPSAVVGLALLYRKTGFKMGWGEFIKTQGIATIVRLVITMGYLALLAFVIFPV